MAAAPSVDRVLGVLTNGRLAELGRELAVTLPARATKEAQIERLVRAAEPSMAMLVGSFTRDELKAACRAEGLDDSGRSRGELARRPLGRDASGDAIPPPIFGTPAFAREVPRAGDIVEERHRQCLVEDVAGPRVPTNATCLSRVCLDDDSQGPPARRSLGARARHPRHIAGPFAAALDPPRHFERRRRAPQLAYQCPIPLIRTHAL